MHKRGNFLPKKLNGVGIAHLKVGVVSLFVTLIMYRLICRRRTRGPRGENGRMRECDEWRGRDGVGSRQQNQVSGDF